MKNKLLTKKKKKLFDTYYYKEIFLGKWKGVWLLLHINSYVVGNFS